MIDGIGYAPARPRQLLDGQEHLLPHHEPDGIREVGPKLGLASHDFGTEAQAYVQDDAVPDANLLQLRTDLEDVADPAPEEVLQSLLRPPRPWPI
jgi:hypothetical protein